MAFDEPREMRSFALVDVVGKACVATSPAFQPASVKQSGRTAALHRLFG